MSAIRKKINIAKILATHGIKGLFKLEIYNINDLDLRKYKNKIYIKNIKLDLEKKFRKGKVFIYGSSLFNSADEVSKFIGEHIWINEHDLEKLQDNEFYHKDLINCKVLDFDSNQLGIVEAIHNFGAGDLLELKNYKYMIRLNDIEKKSIDIKQKVIKLKIRHRI